MAAVSVRVKLKWLRGRRFVVPGKEAGDVDYKPAIRRHQRRGTTTVPRTTLVVRDRWPGKKLEGAMQSVIRSHSSDTLLVSPDDGQRSEFSQFSGYIQLRSPQSGRYPSRTDPAP